MSTPEREDAARLPGSQSFDQPLPPVPAREAADRVFDTFADRVTPGGVDRSWRGTATAFAQLSVVALGALLVAAAVFAVAFSAQTGIDLFGPVTGRAAALETVATLGWAAFWGLLAAAGALAITAVIVGLPWARRQQRARRARAAGDQGA